MTVFPNDIVRRTIAVPNLGPSKSTIKNIDHNNAQNNGKFDDLCNLYKDLKEYDTDIHDIPQNITGYFINNYNINYVDRIVRAYLVRKKGDIPKLREKLKEINKIINNPQTMIERKLSLNEKDRLEKEIEKIEKGKEIQEYIRRTEYLINKYQKYINHIENVNFKNEEEDFLTEETRERINIISEYLKIAKEYYRVDVTHKNKQRDKRCLCCGFLLGNPDLISEYNQVCPCCFTEYQTTNIRRTPKDNTGVSVGPSTSDDSLDNFLKAYEKFMGLRDKELDEELFQQLDHYFVKVEGLPSGEEIKKLPLNSKGRRGKTDRKMLRLALSKIGRSDCYEDYNLIGHEYWGWELPDVAKYREKLIYIYNETQRGFHNIPPEERERNSSPGTQFRLCKELQLVGYDCCMDDFNIAENPESLRIHKKLWKRMCEYTDDPEIYYIP